MRQMIILDAEDLARLKQGYALQLTSGLMLSLQATVKPPDEPGQDRREQKKQYMVRWRRRQRAKRAAVRKQIPCKLGCGALFSSAQGFGGHKAHCPNRRKP